MPSRKPLIVTSASPHSAADAQIPTPTTKRRELCDFLASHSDVLKDNFRIRSTAGFYSWITGGYKSSNSEQGHQNIYDELRTWDIESTAYGGQFGGMVELANEVVSGRSKVVFLFISNSDQTGVNSPANQALARICDYKNVPIYFNLTSAHIWVECLRSCAVTPHDYLPEQDVIKGQAGPLGITIPTLIKTQLSMDGALKRYDTSIPMSERTLALISHDQHKGAMRDFVLFFERTLQRFKRIIATGTTGQTILELTSVRL